LRLLLEREQIEVIGEASNGLEAIDLIHQSLPDIAVLDYEMPQLGGVGVLMEMPRISPKTGSIILTRHMEEPYAIAALRAGARGYVLKTQAGNDVVAAVRHVHRGEVYLSPRISKAVVEAYLASTDLQSVALTSRERQVLQLVGEGNSTKQIAALLGISFKTADSHRAKLMDKLDIHQIAGLVRYAIRSGIVEP